MTKISIAIYGSHDSSICLRTGADNYKVYELERITGKRNYSLSADPVSKSILTWMKDYLKITEIDSIFYGECDPRLLSEIREVFSPVRLTQRLHHHFSSGPEIVYHPY